MIDGIYLLPAFIAGFMVGGGVILTGKVTNVRRKLRDPWYVTGVQTLSASEYEDVTFGPFGSRRAAHVFRRRFAGKWSCALTVSRGDPRA